MAMERDLFVEIVKDAYSAYYTILPAEEKECKGLPLAFCAEYCSKDEQYFLTKSANIWRNEKREYTYVFSAPSFDPKLADACLSWALEDMLPLVKPHKEHQYTNCKVVLLADSLGEETVKTVKKSHFSKSYGLFSLQGYTELIAAAVDLSREKTFTNRVGHSLESFFGKLFALRHEEA